MLDPVLKRFLSYAKPYKWWVAGATTCGLIKYNIPILFPLILKYVIDYLVSDPNPVMAQINWLLAGLLLLYGVWAVITYYRSVLHETASNRMIFDLRYDFFAHLQKLSLGFYEKRKVGAIASRLMGDISTAQGFIGSAFTNSIMDLSTLLVISIILFRMNWQLAVAALLVFPLYVVLNRTFKNRIKEATQKAQMKMEAISGNLHEHLSSVPIVRSFAKEKSEQRRFFRDTREHLDYVLARVHLSSLATTLIGLITSTAPIMVIWFGALQVVHGQLSAGGLVAFYAYLGMLYQPLNRLSELNILLARSRSAMERIFEILDTVPDIIDQPHAREIGRAQGEIELNNVTFGYDNARPVLKNVNLRIPAATSIALVGPSGAGKSTFIRLIPRFYDINAGTIKLDGMDIRNIVLRSLRSNIAWVPQEPILFSGSVRENIQYGRRNASLEEIIAATKDANAHEFILELPQGYETEIGERGVILSGGQKQRLSLARAFLKDAPILILDEATSSLDSESENLIKHALARLKQNRTTITIAHRLSTIQAADMIIVFDNGSIVQSGTHEQLLRVQQGLYRRLYDNQFGFIRNMGAVVV
jgi:ABC-type multidrug transport system fused ATPase/permease subunit